MRKKVLFISSRPIYPIIGGDQIRTAQQLNFLLQRYVVDVVYQTPFEVKDYIPNVQKIRGFKVPKWVCYMQTLRFLFNRLPLQVNYYYNNKMKKYIDSCLHEYDIVFCNNIRTTEYVREFSDVVKIVDFVDAISMNYEKAKLKAHGLQKIIYTIDYKRCKQYEQMVLDVFDRCAIISEVDKQYILQYEKKDICCR